MRRRIALADSSSPTFAYTRHGNALSHDEQWRTLERVVEVATRVWGGVDR